MQKARKGILAVAGRMLLIGFSIQIVLGLTWMLCNFTGYHRFGETFVYEEIAENLICDEYEGILYPVLIRITKGMEGLLSIPYRCFLYLLQLGTAFFAADTLLGSVGVKGGIRRIWGSLALLTFPMAMQCHIAAVPDSFVSSLLLLELALAIAAFRSGELLRFSRLAKVLGCFVAVALLLPDNLFIGAVPPLFLLLYGLAGAWRKDRKRVFSYVVLVFAFLGILSGVNSLTRVEGYYGRAHKSAQLAMAGRCAWLYIGYHYDELPEEVKSCLTPGDALQVSCYADKVEQVLGRKLEEAYGEEHSRELLLALAGQAWEADRDTILHNTAWDVVGYLFSPMVVQRQFNGMAYDSYSGRNYDIMREKNPVLTAYYMDYGCRWFAAGLLVSAVGFPVSAATRLVRRAQDCRKGVPGKTGLTPRAGTVISVVMCLCTFGVLTLVYTLRGAGMMDYKKSVAITLMWMLGMLRLCYRGMAEEQESEG